MHVLGWWRAAQRPEACSPRRNAAIDDLRGVDRDRRQGADLTRCSGASHWNWTPAPGATVPRPGSTFNRSW
ncbi:hypothetical protein HBB16_12965 [Pseudonocardia sp. MCCB 268]|nr:hypothetical protein [Pseudonocardia cytotoxica]